MPQSTAASWKSFLARHPQTHLLQTAAWGQFKAEFGWQPAWTIGSDHGVQVLFRKAPLGRTVAYIPRGLAARDLAAIQPEIDALCREKRAIFLKIEPDVWETTDAVAAPPPGYVAAETSIQPPRTITLDLGDTEEAILARMKQKTPL